LPQNCHEFFYSIDAAAGRIDYKINFISIDTVNDLRNIFGIGVVNPFGWVREIYNNFTARHLFDI
tara:strand:- start:2337 stop:2531 length:195 start_codon:yes stop_codon:yes gene_type:complete